ncbi:MAG: hypothetical protein GYB31_14710 [Bacteroidetes bacterium]|nr:hypothetical protein [Bacteroidota bacterium]
MSRFFALFFACFCFYSVTAQDTARVALPGFSFEEAVYPHGDVKMHDFAQKPDGYWLFEPVAPRPDSARVVVFVHGYGGYNPMVYGGWIRHLVQQGHMVIYPRYQRNMVFPRPPKFADHVARAIQDAKEELSNGDYPLAIWDDLVYVGHSYGGVIISDLAINFEDYEIPKPAGAMICSSGTGWLKGGRLKDYGDMPNDLKLVVFVSENDGVVGDEFSLKVFEEARQTESRIMLRQSADPYGTPGIKDGHNQPYALDQSFDTGVRNYTAKKALRIARIDPVDFNGYWKVFDALMDCVHEGQKCKTALCGCESQTALGFWSDGTPIKALEAVVPEYLEPDSLTREEADAIPAREDSP